MQFLDIPPFSMKRTPAAEENAVSNPIVWRGASRVDSFVMALRFRVLFRRTNRAVIGLSRVRYAAVCRCACAAVRLPEAVVAGSARSFGSAVGGVSRKGYVGSRTPVDPPAFTCGALYFSREMSAIRLAVVPAGI